MTAPEPKIHIFEAVLLKYLDLLKSQFKSYPIISNILDKRLSVANKALARFIDNHSVKSVDSESDEKKLSIEPNHYKPLMKLVEEISHSIYAIDLTPATDLASHKL